MEVSNRIHRTFTSDRQSLNMEDENPQVDNSHNSSEAFPPSWQRPDLSSFIGTVVDESDLAALTLKDVIFRRVVENDLQEVAELHKEWFPLKYGDDFFNLLPQPYFHTIAATLPASKLPENTKNNMELAGMEDLLVGLIVFSHDGRRVRPEVLDRARSFFSLSYADVGYIYTIGVSEKFRRRGLAGELIDRAYSFLASNFPQTSCLALHVIDYNASAYNMYLKNGFKDLGYVRNYYEIEQAYYGGFMMAKFLPGFKPPFEWRVSNWMSKWF